MSWTLTFFMDATKRRLAYLDKDGIMVEKFAYSGLNEGNNNPNLRQCTTSARFPEANGSSPARPSIIRCMALTF
jgi:hypothetical protein